MRAGVHSKADGRFGAREPRRARVLVWDPLVRLVHWSLAGVILFNGLIGNPETALHREVGYIALGLVLARLLWGLVGSDNARFSAFPPSPRRALAHLGDIRKGRAVVHKSHNPLGALMVYNIWATVLGLVATGYMMGTRMFFGYNWVQELHEALFSWMMISVALHLAGVAFDNYRTKVGLVPAMITGYKKLPIHESAE